nr:MAG TPA: PROTEIN/RNA Complex ribosomal subunit, ribonucleoprotein, ribosomal [Herelleviridae sp.]
MNRTMKKYQIMYRMKCEDYPFYQEIDAIDECDAIVDFFEILEPVKPEQIEIIRLERL